LDILSIQKISQIDFFLRPWGGLIHIEDGLVDCS